jgi:hypothetical protein
MTTSLQESELMDQQRIVWVFSTLLLLAVQLNVAAQEVRIEVAHSTTTVKCAGVENHLAIVKASMPTAGADANASAFGFALIPANGDVRMFARYWFFFTDKVLSKRDDDSGTLGRNLIEAEQTLKPKVEKFFGDCSVANAKPVILEVLDRVTTETSVTDVISALSTTGLQFSAVTESKQNLANSLTDNAESHVALSAVMRTTVQLQSDGTRPPPGPPNEVKASLDQSEAIKKNVKELEAKIDSLSSWNRELSILLVAALSLSAALVIAAILLFSLKPRLLHRILAVPEVTNEITQRIVTAVRLMPPPNSGNENARSTDHAENKAIREFISNHFGRKFLDPDVEKNLGNLTSELNQHLLPLAHKDANGSSRTLSRLKSAGKQVQTMWEAYSEKPCPSGALTTLQKDWAALQNTFQPFKQNDFAGVLSHARESVAVFQLFHERFRDQNHKPEEVRQEFDGLLKELEKTYNDFTSPEQRITLSPRYQFADLSFKLHSYNETTQSVITTIQKVLPNASGPIDEMTSALVAKLNSNTELVSNAEAIKAANEKLTSELETLKTQAEESTQLAGALSRYVYLSTDTQLDSPQVQAILQTFTAGNYTHRQLRLRLSAALEALDHAVATVTKSGCTNALAALRISDFKDHLAKVLTNIEQYAGEELWKKCLSSGFSEERWLHHLLRAELVARTYFADDDSLALLIAPLSEASTALVATIREFNVHVPLITLLSDPPAGAQVRYEVDSKLKELMGFKQKVHARLEQLKQGEDPKFIVDVELFPWRSDTIGNDGEVIAISGSQ